MPYKSEKIKIERTEFDSRIKITPEMRADILEEQGRLSQRATARKYGVSRNSVVFIWFPERLKRSKELYKIRRLDGRYYKKEKHTEQVRRYRTKKHILYKRGVIKLSD